MKKYLLLFFFIAQILNAQTLVETVDLPSGTFWNSAYGMVYENSKYWISSSSSSAGGGIFYAVDNTGMQVDQVNINYPSMRASQGLAFDGTNFWYVERKTARCDLFKVAPDGTVLDSITSSQLFGGSVYMGGAGWDGTHLWISHYFPNDDAALYKIDVNTKTIIDTIQTFGTQPQGITFKGDTLFYVMDDNDGDDERIFAVNVNTKDTLFSFHVPDLSSQSPRGLAWDGTYFWLLAEPVGGNINQRQLFKYDLSGSGTPQIFVPFTTLNFPNTTVGTTSDIVLQIFNNGTADLIIDSLKIVGNTFSFDPLSFPITITPGNSVDVTVNFSPIEYALYQGSLSIFSNDPIDPVVLVSLRGRGLLVGARIGFTATEHNFGNVWVGNEGISFWKFKTFNMGNTPLEITNMFFDLPEFSFDAPSIPFVINSTDTVEISVYFYPNSTGTFTDSLVIVNGDITNQNAKIAVEGTGTFNNYNYGYMFWNYQVPPHPNSQSAEPEVEALKPINDITGDGIPEVMISTENYFTMCLDGAASGSSYPLWIFTTYMGSNNTGSIGANFEFGVQDAMQIANDLNNDGFNDVVIATGGGNEHVYALDGTNGNIIWKYGDDINFSLGDFEAVDVQRDFTGDGIEDVLAIADGNSQGTGYKRAYLFNGTDGQIIWEYFYPGPNPSFGKSIISIEDFTGDSKPDVVIAVGNNGSTNLKVIGLDGTNGNFVWDADMVDNEPKELLELPLPGGGSDVIAAEYFGRIHRLNSSNGDEVWEYILGPTAGVIQINLLKDITSDDIPEILIASFAGSGLNCLNGADGSLLWNYPMDFQYGVYSVPDLDFDGSEDVVTGDQNGVFYCISGKGDSLIFTHTFNGDRISTVNVMPSIDGNYSYELLAGTKNGKVTNFSGGVDTSSVNVFEGSRLNNYQLLQNYPNPFNPSTTIEFNLIENALTSLKIYDVLGREVTTLINEELSAGNHKLVFSATGLASGIYFYKLRTGDFISTKKMLLLK